MSEIKPFSSDNEVIWIAFQFYFPIFPVDIPQVKVSSCLTLVPNMKEGRLPVGGTYDGKQCQLNRNSYFLPWRITLCFHFIISPPALTTTTLVSLGSFQIWQHLLHPRAPETTAISYSETTHLESNCIFARMQELRSVHMPWAWIMAHIPNKLNGFGAYCLRYVEMSKNDMLLGLFHLETWRWKFGCFKAINVTKFNLSTVLRPGCGWVSEIKGRFKSPPFLTGSQRLLFGNDVSDQKTVVLLHRKLLLLSIIGVGIPR